MTVRKPSRTEEAPAPASPHMAATVMDLGRGGRTAVHQASAPETAPAPAMASESLKHTGKETMRDVRTELLRNLEQAPGPEPVRSARPQRIIYRLVPIHGTDHPEVTLEEGNVVEIAGLRFRFSK